MPAAMLVFYQEASWMRPSMAVNSRLQRRSKCPIWTLFPDNSSSICGGATWNGGVSACSCGQETRSCAKARERTSPLTCWSDRPPSEPQLALQRFDARCGGNQARAPKGLGGCCFSRNSVDAVLEIWWFESSEMESGPQKRSCEKFIFCTSVGSH